MSRWRQVWLPSVRQSTPAASSRSARRPVMPVALGGVLAVADDEVEVELLAQLRQLALDRLAAGAPEDVRDEEDPQRSPRYGIARVGAGSTQTWALLPLSETYLRRSEISTFDMSATVPSGVREADTASPTRSASPELAASADTWPTYTTTDGSSVGEIADRDGRRSCRRSPRA